MVMCVAIARVRGRLALQTLLSALRAAGEPTRLRLLAVCAHGEVTVGELARIVGQSQPRVSRHLKLLCDAGLLDRFREGSWAFYRIAGPHRPGANPCAPRILAMIPVDDPQISRDRERLEAIKRVRADEAAAYFRANAARWDRVRALHVDTQEVERALADALRPDPGARFLDIGTGTGRVLQLFGGSVGQGTGIDLSLDMLRVARANLESAGLANCQVRHADMYRLPFDDGSFDAAAMHMVLHYADRPAAAVAEAGRVLRPGGRLAVADFAAHDVERLRTEHAHRRLGFSDGEMAAWFDAAGLCAGAERRLAGEPLTVVVWAAAKPAAAGERGAARPADAGTADARASRAAGAA